MNKDIRNGIQRQTQAARSLLENEYAAQLEGIFDIHPEGTIAPEPGGHLTPADRVLRDKIVAAIEHHHAGGLTRAQAVTTYVREAAFTTLNRFVALKMLEARELVQECVSRGDQSAGFKEFTGLASGLAQLADRGYRIYLEGLFDEVGREIGVLFERREPASLLWPRRLALLDLLDILNVSELVSVWKEDETIGWVYQYFNSDEERRKMRDPKEGGSQVPRNSYELAVRNQFFTPRYVVEFLTDNTLGRIWYEMRQGRTRLKDECEYLVRYPSEVFAAQEDGEPPEGPSAGEYLTQEQLLGQSVFVPFRATKDPRDIKVLDPACGSGHFLLYAFDLLLAIYEEAWTDGDSPPSEATGCTLKMDYPTLDELHQALPGLIIRQNLYGIDIDPRAAQIAALALWMRVQRAHNDFGITGPRRLPLTKTNVVVAEPMPGEKELREEFLGVLDSQLGALINRVFEKMELAGEAGYLLKIQEEIECAIRDIYGGIGGLFQETDEKRWQAAEVALLEALDTYAKQVQNGGSYRRRLFVEDTARGFSFIDLCRQRYDVVLMNPPFGASTSGLSGLLASQYPTCSKNTAAAFVERATSLLEQQGTCGAIVDTTILQKSSYQAFRTEVILSGNRLAMYVRLGWDVLDAQVDASVVVLHESRTSSLVLWSEASPPIPESLGKIARAARADDSDRPFQLRSTHSIIVAPHAALTAGGLSQSDTTNFRLGFGIARQGVAVPDAFRFIRLYWEVPGDEVGAGKLWSSLSHGGGFSPFFRDYYFIVLWGSDGYQIKQEICIRYPYLNGNWGWVARNSDYYMRPGLAYGKRTDFLSAQIAPAGMVFSNEGSGIFPLRWEEVWMLLSIANSPAIARQINTFCGQHKYSGYVDKIQVPNIDGTARAELKNLGQRGYLVKRKIASRDETSHHFSGLHPQGETVAHFVDAENERREEARHIVAQQQQAIDEQLFPGVPAKVDRPDGAISLLTSAAVFSYALGLHFGRWNERKEDEKSEYDLVETAFLPLAEPICPRAHNSSTLVDDPGHPDDILERVISELNRLSWDKEQSITKQLCDALVLDREDEKALRDWVRTSFFDHHIRHYSIGRRKAPLYWQIATPSASYSVWLYYQCLSGDTFHQVMNDCVTPKLHHEERRLDALLSPIGSDSTAAQRKEITEQQAFVDELRAFREEIARVAPLWNPDLNDGVIINFAPLWRLVPQHRAWQRECKGCWDKLVAGEYDWAHLAMHLWPERVVPKCAKDRSLAIAHGLENLFWAEDMEGKWKGRNIGKETVDSLIAERTSPAVKEALGSLLSASPLTSAGKGRTKGASREPKIESASGGRPDTQMALEIGSTARRSEVDPGVLSKITAAIGFSIDGAGRAEVLARVDLTEGEWNAAIQILLARGEVTKTGEKRGTRYRLVKDGGES